MDQVARMAFLRQQLHQPVLAVAGVQAERHPYQQAAGYDSERNAYPLVRTCQIEDDHRQEHRHQTAREGEQYCDLSPLNSTGLPAPCLQDTPYA